MEKIISGIQQIGIGVTNIDEGWKWYSKFFGMDIQIFNDSSVAELMLPYTNNQKCKRHAILAVSIQGGGGFEIWQHTGKTPELPKFETQIGDYGIFAAKIKTKDINASFEYFKSNGVNILKDIDNTEFGKYFFIKDPFGNIFQIVQEDNMFTKGNHANGGVYGCIIGVSDIEKAKKVYSDILGYDKVISEKEGFFDDLSTLPGGKNKLQRVLLKHSQSRKGAFSKFLGASCIELVKVIDRQPKKIFENRIWGDPGFIHLCIDISGMNATREECSAKGFPFTVDTGKGFDMGDASGHFSYIEDNDGTLIEFVETHKLPIIKKIGWYFNLKNRNPEKPLPDWMIKALKFNRVKN